MAARSATSTSMPPKRSTIPPTAADMPERSGASAWKIAAPVSAATVSSGSRRRPISARLVPSLASLRAAAAPMPVPPPVITAVLSLKRISILPSPVRIIFNV
ncbi:hypothetical protein FHU14_003639 [Mesorhizobium sp. RMAD-H1]|nr:hypothetical protein [Mesorhizobium sp. RMAD-H1]